MNADDEDHRYYYNILNISPSASLSEIQKAYKSLSLIFHPDKANSSDDDTFVAIKTAHDVLTDPIYRKAYDYGGQKAVYIIKRSQQLAAAASNNKKNNNTMDLYQQMETSNSDEAMIRLLQEAVEEFELQQDATGPHTHRSVSYQLHTAVEVPYSYTDNNHNNMILEREKTHLSVSLRQQQQSYATTTYSVSSLSQHNSTMKVDSNLTYDYTVGTINPTHWVADARFSTATTTDSSSRWWWWPQQVSVRTTRQLASGTFLVFALAGRPSTGTNNNNNSWNYSILSHRNLQLLGNGDDNNKVQALVRLGLQPTGLAFAMASLKTLSFPQWRCRLTVGGPYPFKVGYKSALKDFWSISYSWNWLMWSRIKVTRSITVYRWTICYGIKRDARASVLGATAAGAPVWSIVCHGQSNDWSIRVPIYLPYHHPAPPVAWVITLLVGQWLDEQLQQWTTANTTATRSWRKTAVDVSSPVLYLWKWHPEAFRQAASKKQQNEGARGLVILDATLDGTVNLTCCLQFCVHESRLRLPLSSLLPLPDLEQQQPSGWRWWGSHHKGISQSHELVVRYQYQGSVYEVVVTTATDTADRLLVLPNRAAMRLGFSDVVQ